MTQPRRDNFQTTENRESAESIENCERWKRRASARRQDALVKPGCCSGPTLDICHHERTSVREGSVFCRLQQKQIPRAQTQGARNDNSCIVAARLHGWNANPSLNELPALVSSVVKKNPFPLGPAITVTGAVVRRPSQQGSSQHFHVVGLIIAVCKYAVPRCGRTSPDARCLKKDVDREIVTGN